MKHSIFFVIVVALLATVACNTIDTELVDKIQASLNKVQDSKPGIEADIRNAANLRDQMANAPVGLKASTEFGYGDLQMKADAFHQKYNSIAGVQTELVNKLEALLADYTDGKIKKDAVIKEYEALQNEAEGIKKYPERMTPMFDQLSADYAKMMANWQALPETQRNALNAKYAGTMEGGAIDASAGGVAGGGGAVAPGALTGGAPTQSKPQAAQPQTTKPHSAESLVKPKSGGNK